MIVISERSARMHRLLFTALGLLVLLLGGCGTLQAYEGPALDASETALVKQSSETRGWYIVVAAYWESVKLVAIDEYRLDLHTSARVLPGSHTAVMSIEYGVAVPYAGDGGSADTRHVTFFAEAGHTYVIHSVYEWEQWYIWVQEQESGEWVGGQPPP